MFVETDDERKTSSCGRSLLDLRRNALLICNLRGRSPPDQPSTHVTSVYPNRKERCGGDTICTEVQRPLRSRQGPCGPAGDAGAPDDHPRGRGSSQLAPGQQEAEDPPAPQHGGRGRGLGSVLGFLFGLIFFVPFLGAAIGAGMGGMTGALADVGIDDDFIREVREKVTEGTSALFALTSGATAPDKVIDELKHYDFEIISTNLPEEQEKQLREAFSQEG